MAAFAPPVHRDKFLYSSVLYADAGSDNHHPRASITELTALLRPEAPKAKKSKTSEITEPVRDPPWHFWTAQLIHYGLTATKDKNAAKIRLLGALNGGRLEVPAWILKLEVELKKEWEAENRKLKKAAKGGATLKPIKSEQGSAVAKSPPVKEKASARKNGAAAEKGAGSKKPPMKPTAFVTPQPTTTKRKRDEAGQASVSEPSKKAKSKSTVDKAPLPIQQKSSQNSVLAGEESWPEPRRRAIPHDAWKFFDDDHLAHTRPPSAPHPRPYRVSCPDAEREWYTDSIEEFYLAFSATEEEWWSRFKWGAFKGILILQRQPKRVNKAVGVPFKWRAHYAHGNEDGDGEGKIFFDSQSSIRGEFYDFFRQEPCRFRGEAIQSARRSANGQAPPPDTPVLDQMRVEWSQMATAMHDAPAKKPRAKKEKPSVPISKHSNTAASGSSGEQNDVYLSGTYNINSDTIEETFLLPAASLPLRLTLFTEESTGIWWADFQWACFDGVIKINPGPTYDTIDRPHSLGWRIRNTETGSLTFGRDCTGEIHFDGENRALVGTLFGVPGVGRVDFDGKRMAGPRRVGGLGSEWDWFVGEAYGRV